jgi:hypothetical protein
MWAVAGTVAASLAGTFYLALGVAALARPSTLLTGFGLVVAGRDGRNEVRAVYGGFPLAAAALVFSTLAGAPHADGVLLALAGSTLGMALGRVVSAAVDGGIGQLPLIFVFVELIVAALLAVSAVLPWTFSAGK